MTFVIGDIKHANLADFLLSLLGYREPGADSTNTLQSLRGYLEFLWGFKLTENSPRGKY